MSGTFIPAQDHLLVDTAAEKRFNFRLSSAFQAAQRNLLLAGMKIWMTPGRVPTDTGRSGHCSKDQKGHCLYDEMKISKTLLFELETAARSADCTQASKVMNAITADAVPMDRIAG